MKNKYIPLNCSQCGKFVGKDGFHDIYDGEIGYPLCKRCLDNQPRCVYEIEQALLYDKSCTDEEIKRVLSYYIKFGVR